MKARTSSVGARVRHALADQHERALRRLQHVERLLDILWHRHACAAAPGIFCDLDDVVLVARSGDQVVGEVEIARARTAVDRLPHRHLDIVRDAVDVLDGMGPLADRGRGQDLALFLERAHAVAVGLGRAADQDHRPAVLLGIGEAGDAVDDAGAGHDDARARPAGQEADGAGGVGRGLLVAHSDIGQPDLLRRFGDRPDREPDDAEHVFDALRLEALGQQVGALDLSHKNPPFRENRPARRGARARSEASPPDYAFIRAGQMASSRRNGRDAMHLRRQGAFRTRRVGMQQTQAHTAHGAEYAEVRPPVIA